MRPEDAVDTLWSVQLGKTQSQIRSEIITWSGNRQIVFSVFARSGFRNLASPIQSPHKRPISH